MRRVCAVVDLIVVLIFVGIGRSVHDHGVYAGGMASTAWPFVAGLVLGWLVVTKLRRSGTSPGDGIIICLVTVLVGMILRVIVGQGTAFAFVLVALGFLGAFMIGGRVLLVGTKRLRKTGGSR
jgi:hypothetical protein